MPRSASRRRLRRWPWAALCSLLLAAVAAVAGLVLFTARSDISVQVRGADVTESQVLASMDGLRAYAPFTLRVCGLEEAEQCQNPGPGLVTIRQEAGMPVTEVAPDLLRFPLLSSDGIDEDSAHHMIQQAATDAALSGQGAGQPSAAAAAVVEAQSLSLHRSPLLWGGLFLAFLLTAFVLGFRHQRQWRRQTGLEEQIAHGAKALSAALIRLDEVELTAAQLEMLHSDADTAAELAKQLRRLPGRILELVREQDELQSWHADTVFTKEQAARITRFQDHSTAFSREVNALCGQAALLMHPTSSVWDLEARPLLESQATVESALKRIRGTRIKSARTAVETLSQVREDVLGLGARRMTGTGSIVTEDLQELVRLTMLVDEVLAELVAGLTKVRNVQPRRDLPKDLRKASHAQGVRLRSEPGMAQRPLVRQALGGVQRRGVMTAQGFRSWADDVILVPGSRKSVSQNARQARAESGRRSASKHAAGRRYGSLRELWTAPAAVACACVVAGLVLGSIVGSTPTWLEEYERTEHPTLVSAFTTIPENENYNSAVFENELDPDFNDVLKDGYKGVYDPVTSYRPIKLVVVELPADLGQDRVKPLTSYSEGRERDKEEERRERDLNVPVPSVPDAVQAVTARQLVRTAVRENPELLDPRTGDLMPEAVVMGLRQVSSSPQADEEGRSHGSGLSYVYYRLAAWGWGPAYASQSDGGEGISPRASDTAEGRGLGSELLETLLPKLAETHGRPLWITAPSTRVAVTLGTTTALIAVITLVLWLNTKPWLALGASGRRRRASDATLERTRADLLARFSREDEDSLNMLLAVRGGPEAESDAGSVEAERHRIRTRAQAMALRQAEELAAAPRAERSTQRFARQVAALEDMVRWIDSSSEKTAQAVQRHLDSVEHA
ncbi:hypothetical protein [Galactobacter sp.]|uniref:hypothetical protein n=1 Tax=Galactobacter sp. TaxID=2676125 RepID=UPI0025C3E490|nr:hypothetical protein [Galactobacter sp.]